MSADGLADKKMVGAYTFTTSLSESSLEASNAVMTNAVKINDSGQILVEGTLNGKTGKFLYQDRKLTSFSDEFQIYSARSLNNRGEVVGAAQKSDGSYFAYVWSKTEGLRDLNELIPNNEGWYLAEATGINDKGQITGYGYINGKTRSFILDLEEIEPIIFVPGIGGSNLNKASGANVWLGGMALLNGFQDLTLDPNKTQTDIVAGDALRKVEPFNQFVQNVYDPLFNYVDNKWRLQRISSK